MTGPHHDAVRITRDTLDFAWSRFRSRTDGLMDDEYRWEPVDEAWSVRRDVDGVWRAHPAVPEPATPVVTTIAWRTWHVASDCLAGYTVRGLGDWPLADLPRGGTEWYPDVADALSGLDRCWDAFRKGLDNLGDDGMWRQLGPAFGPYAEETWLALAMHALDEVAHHGGEIGLLRDLHYARSSAGR